MDCQKNDLPIITKPSKSLSGLKVLVTAGPTYEYIDPISYIGNRSSGKMGFALANAAHEAGAEVVLISGPVNMSDPDGITCIKVVSAQEMQQAVFAQYSDTNIVIMAAAVADYRPAKIIDIKIKKGQHPKQLELIRTPDILAKLGVNKANRFLVGFAAETNDLEKYAKNKLLEKNLDLILANDVSQSGAGFDVDTNIITAFYDKNIKQYPQMTKKEIAKEIIDLIVQLRS